MRNSLLARRHLYTPTPAPPVLSVTGHTACHTTWSTMVQVMACCLTDPSHYVNRCQWIPVGSQSTDDNLTWIKISITIFSITHFKLKSHLPNAIGLSGIIAAMAETCHVLVIITIHVTLTGKENALTKFKSFHCRFNQSRSYPIKSRNTHCFIVSVYYSQSIISSQWQKRLMQSISTCFMLFVPVRYYRS